MSELRILARANGLVVDMADETSRLRVAVALLHEMLERTTGEVRLVATDEMFPMVERIETALIEAASHASRRLAEIELAEKTGRP